MSRLPWWQACLFVLCLSSCEQLAFAITSAPSWKPRELVTDNTSLFGQTGSDRYLAYDHHGNPGIASYISLTADLQYSRRTPGVGWVNSVIDPGPVVGQYPSLAYDRHERPAVSHFEVGTGRNLRYAYFTGTTWVIELADTTGDVGQYTSLAFDLAGQAAISYYSITDSALKYIHDTDGDQSLVDEIAVVVSNVEEEGVYSSLVFDSINRPMIVHTDLTNRTLRYSIEEPGIGWVTTTIDSSGVTGDYPSIAIDPDTGHPAVAYYRATGSDLMFTQWNGVNWEIPTVVDGTGNTGLYPSLAFDPADGNPAIAYRDNSNTALKLAWHNGSNWQNQIVDNVGDVGNAPSLAFNDFGDGFNLTVDIVAACGSAADFDCDGDVDGQDFLVWQRGNSAQPNSMSDLNLWQSHYGSASLVAATAAVPEPTCLAMTIVSLAVFLRCQSRY